MQCAWLNPQLFMGEANAGFEVFALALYSSLLRRRRRYDRVWLPLVCQREEPGELPSGRLAIGLPEFRILYSEHAGAGDNHLQRKRAAGAQLAVLLRIFPNADVPLSHTHPLHGDAAVLTPHSRVA